MTSALNRTGESCSKPRETPHSAVLLLLKAPSEFVCDQVGKGVFFSLAKQPGRLDVLEADGGLPKRGSAVS